MIAVAAAIRVVLIVAYGPVLMRDSASYLDLAHRLGALHLHGYDAARTPGYPAVLLALGYSARAAWWLQAVLGVVSTTLVYGLVRRLGAGAKVALVASGFYVVDLEVLAVERMVMTETIASFLILLAVFLAVGLLQSERARLRAALLVGLTLACLCIVRPDMTALSAYLTIVVALVLARRQAPRAPLRTALRYGGAILALPVVVLAAWAGVNRATIGVTTVSTVLGRNMIDHVAADVRATPGSDYPITSAYVAARASRELHTQNLANLSTNAEAAMERRSHLDSAHLSGRLLGIALGVIASHPVQYVESSVKQIPRFFLPPNYAYAFNRTGSGAIRVVWKIERAFMLLIAVVFLALSGLSIVQRLRRRVAFLTSSSAVLAGAVAVGILPAAFLALGETGRYGYVYFPLVLIVALVSAAPLLRFVQTRRSSANPLISSSVSRTAHGRADGKGAPVR